MSAQLSDVCMFRPLLATAQRCCRPAYRLDCNQGLGRATCMFKSTLAVQLSTIVSLLVVYCHHSATTPGGYARPHRSATDPGGDVQSHRSATDPGGDVQSHRVATTTSHLTGHNWWF